MAWDPPLAEVQVAEQQPFLEAWGQVQEIQDLGHPGSARAGNTSKLPQ